MFLVYIVVSAFVMVLLLAIPLFPFWKVWARMKTHHPDIWKSAGPFEPRDMIRSPGLIDIFLQVVIRMVNDKSLIARDPVIVKWCRAGMEVVHMIPHTWPSRIASLLVLIYLSQALAHLLLTPFRP